MNRQYQVIIVGSGLAGMAAADLLSRHGLSVLVVDDNAHSGGQLLRKPLYAGKLGRRFEPDRLKRWGMQLLEKLRKSKVHFLNGTQVLGIYPERTLLVEQSRGYVAEYCADSMILATGARERHLPFTGWTLPGVMATGAAQILMKSSGILPGRKTLIGGCGPLMLVLAAEILANGGKVRAVLDQCKAAKKLNAITAGPAIWPKLFEGAVYLTRLAAARVPMKQGVRLVEARGRQELEAVVAARVDTNDCIIQGTEKIYPTNTLAVGYGFSPNIELPQQAGCSVSYSVDKGGWHVNVDASMATTVTDIYAVGETTGIAGAGKSLIEGQIAAWDFLYRQGRVNRKDLENQIGPLMSQRGRQLQYGRFINQLCRLEPDCYTGISDETMICRCEEVTMGEVRRQLYNGFATMNGIKKATRCGMGNCQGRTCGPILFDIISAFTQRPPASVGYTSARSPVKTVSLGALAQMTMNSREDHEDRSHG
ncbi:MAG: FAD/NAD(P)-binding oxidoreductase [Desulfobacterales bacterium]|jgi:NADPH-dependent 2,4-dienoyl-CoA reductase/sulfur reductase-like enzyme